MPSFRSIVAFLLRKNSACFARDYLFYHLRGVRHFHKQALDKAIADQTEAIRLNPTFSDAYQERGIVYFAIGEYDRAIADQSEAIRLNPDNPDPYVNRGANYRKKQEYDKALEDYATAIRLDPSLTGPYHNRGVLYDYKQEYDKAIADFTEAIRLYDTDTAPYVTSESPFPPFQKGKPIDPRLAEIHYSRGNAYLKKEEYEKAMSDFREAIRINPKEFKAHGNLAWLLATCPKDGIRDGKKAIEYAKKACQLCNWKLAAALDMLAAAHAECGNFKDAVKWQHKAIELGYEYPEDMKKSQQRLELYEEGKPYRDK